MDDFMSDDNETGGRFVKWTEEGEEVFGVVLSFSVDGGTAFDGGPAPRLVVQPVRRTGDLFLRRGGERRRKRVGRRIRSARRSGVP